MSYRKEKHLSVKKAKALYKDKIGVEFKDYSEKD